MSMKKTNCLIPSFQFGKSQPILKNSHSKLYDALGCEQKPTLAKNAHLRPRVTHYHIFIDRRARYIPREPAPMIYL